MTTIISYRGHLIYPVKRKNEELRFKFLIDDTQSVLAPTLDGAKEIIDRMLYFCKDCKENPAVTRVSNVCRDCDKLRKKETDKKKYLKKKNKL